MNHEKHIANLASLMRYMKHSSVHQYATAGLTSSLIGGKEGTGNVRLFEAERNTREWITPHSHRFDFSCFVVAGTVENIIFTPSGDAGADSYVVGTVRPVDGGMGKYEVIRHEEEEPRGWTEVRKTYKSGEFYAMAHDEIHSIVFNKGAKVIFFEGPNVIDTSVFLEPFSNGKRIETFQAKSWMFDKEGT